LRFTVAQQSLGIPSNVVENLYAIGVRPFVVVYISNRTEQNYNHEHGVGSYDQL